MRPGISSTKRAADASVFRVFWHAPRWTLFGAPLASISTSSDVMPCTQCGFFAGVRTSDVVRVYETVDNRERLRRTLALAARRGATASQVALAWVLHQPFPTYALVGPRSVAELRESVAALDLALTPAESRWLDLESGTEEP